MKVYPESNALRGMGAVVVAALLLRVIRIGLGLPDFLEEAIPFRLALGMHNPDTGAVTFNPHAFNYPSLSIYIHLAVQQALYVVGHVAGRYANWADYVVAFWRDPTPMVLAARWVGILADLFTVLGVMCLARRLRPGGELIAGSIVAVAPALIATSHSIYCDPIMTAFAVWSIERAAAWQSTGSRSNLVTAAVLAGLAAGAKYPAAVVLVAIAVVILMARGRHGFALVFLTIGIAGFTFCLTTPYAILSHREFLRDLTFESAHAQGGHFGSLAHRSYLFHLTSLLGNLGWLGIMFLAGSLVFAKASGQGRSLAIALWTMILGFGLPIALARIDASRYILPVVALSAPLVAAVYCRIFEWLGDRMNDIALRPYLQGGLAVALLAAPTWAGMNEALAGSSTTQLEAKRWLELHLGPTQLLVQEGYGARLATATQLAKATDDPIFRAASGKAQEGLLATPTFHVIALPLGVSGSVVTNTSTGGGEPVSRIVYRNASELNHVFYEPALYAEADFFLTSSAVRGRYEAEPDRYPVQCAFYHALSRHARLARTFEASGWVSGPRIEVYRLGTEWKKWASDPLAVDWWTRRVPVEVAGIATLTPVFDAHIGTFALDLTTELTALGRYASANALAKAMLTVHPDDGNAALLASICQRKLSRPDLSLATLASAAAHGAPRSPEFLLERARASLATGDVHKAREDARAILMSLPPQSPIVGAANMLLLQSRGRPAKAYPATFSPATTNVGQD